MLPVSCGFSRKSCFLLMQGLKRTIIAVGVIFDVKKSGKIKVKC